MICSGMCISGYLLQHFTAPAVPSVLSMQHNAMYSAPRQLACLQQAHACQAPSPHASRLPSVGQPRELLAASTPALASSSTSLVSQKSAAKRQVLCLSLYISCQVLSCASVWTDIARMSETWLPVQVEMLIQQSGASPYRASPGMRSAMEALIAENPSEDPGMQTLALGQGTWEVGHGLSCRGCLYYDTMHHVRYDMLVCQMLMRCRACLLARVSRAILT